MKELILNQTGFALIMCIALITGACIMWLIFTIKESIRDAKDMPDWFEPDIDQGGFSPKYGFVYTEAEHKELEKFGADMDLIAQSNEHMDRYACIPIDGQPDDENIALILNYIKPGMRIKYVGKDTLAARKGMKGTVSSITTVKHWTHPDVKKYFPQGVAMMVSLDDGGSFGHTCPSDWEEIKLQDDYFSQCSHDFSVPRLHGHMECIHCGLLRTAYSNEL